MGPAVFQHTMFVESIVLVTQPHCILVLASPRETIVTSFALILCHLSSPPAGLTPHSVCNSILLTISSTSPTWEAFLTSTPLSLQWLRFGQVFYCLTSPLHHRNSHARHLLKLCTHISRIPGEAPSCRIQDERSRGLLAVTLVP